MGLLDWAKHLKDEVLQGLGTVGDAIIPGDQSSWHQPSAPTPQAPRPSAPAPGGLSNAQRALQIAASPTSPTGGYQSAPMFQLAPPPVIAPPPAANPAANGPKPLTPQQQKAADFLAKNGKVDPNYKSHSPNLLDDTVEAIKGIGGSVGDLAHGITDIAPRLAVQGATMIDPNHDYSFQAQDPVRKFIFGDSKIDPYVSDGGTNGTGQANQFGAWLKEHGVGDTAANLAVIPAAGALAAADLFTGGKGKVALEGLAKAGTEDAVKIALEKHLGEAAASKIPDHVVQAITAEKDPNKIYTMLKGGADIPAPLSIGMRVKAGDRNNIGTIVSTNGDGQHLVRFMNKKEGTTATKLFDPSELRPTNKSKAIAPPDPQGVLEAIKADPTLEPLGKTTVTPTTGPETRGFVENVLGGSKTPDEIKAGVSGGYKSITNADTLASADADINKQGLIAALHENKVSDSGDVLMQAKGLRLADYLQAEGLKAKDIGDEATANAHFNDAIDVLNKVAERATRNGQDTQILAAYQRLSPEGVVRYAMKGINDAKKADPKRYGNLSLEAGKAAELRAKADAIQAMPEGIDKMVATHKMLTDIARLTPSTNVQKALTLWKAGLLTGIKGQLGNQVGNASHLLMRKLADVPAASIDATIGTISGQRGKTFTLKGLLSGTGEGLVAAKNQLIHGFDPQSIVNNKYDVKGTYFSDSPLGKAAQTYADMVFRMTGAGDRPYYYAALRNSLQDQAKAAAITAGARGSARKAFIKDLIASPTEEILVRATSDAQEAVFGNDNAIGQALKGLKRGLSTKGGALGEIASEVNVPFTGVPSAVAQAVISYSPAGAVKAIYDAIRTTKTTGFTADAQRELSTSLGRAATGTGIMWLGYKLMLDGKMTGPYPTDANERTLWQQEGKQPYSVLIGDKWRSLNYTGPIMALMGVGAQVATSEKAGADPTSAIAGAAGGAAQSVIASSPLKGIQGGLDFVNDPTRNGKTYVNNLAGTVIPTVVKDVSNATDDTKRVANTPLEAIQAKIPGVRNGMAPQIDEFGNPIKQDQTGAGAIFDPFKSTQANTDDPIVSELRRLQDAGKGIVPSKQDAAVTLGGQNVKLDAKQLNDYKEAVGQSVTTLWSSLMSSPEYQQLDDAGKNKALLRAKDAATAATNAQFAEDNQLGDPKKARSSLSGLSASVAGGHTDPALFTSESKDYSQALKVQAMKDSYAADKAAGTLSAVDDYKRRKAILAAEKTVGQETAADIAKKYSKDAVSIAALSKTDKAMLLSNGTITQAQIDEAKAYKDEISTRSGKGGKKKGTRVKIARGGGIKKITGYKISKAKAPKISRAKITKVKKAKIAKVKIPMAKNA